MRRIFTLMVLLGGCGGTSTPEGFLDPCQTDADCTDPELICANVPNQYSGFVTTDRRCTTQCAGTTDCPELICSDWVGTELECLETAETGGACGVGTVGDIAVDVCGM